MKIENKKLFFAGIAILAILLLSYFIKLESESGANFEVKESLLGIIIFHSPIVLSTYLIIAVLLIFFGLRKTKAIQLN